MRRSTRRACGVGHLARGETHGDDDGADRDGEDAGEAQSPAGNNRGSRTQAACGSPTVCSAGASAGRL